MKSFQIWLAKTLYVTLTLVCATNAVGAEYSLSAPGILIEGKINKGDYRRLAEFISSKPENLLAFLRMVKLDSTGGDVIESMKIANLFEKSYANVFVADHSQCYSSCFLIWASGSMRNLQKNAELGVHRITLPDYKSQLTKAEAALAPISQGVEQYLLRLGIPRRIVDKMNETSSSDIFIITNRWLISEGIGNAVGYRPILIDMAQKKCGADPFAQEMRTGVISDEQAAYDWMVCVDEIRTENQTHDMDKIVKLLFDGWLQ